MQKEQTWKQFQNRQNTPVLLFHLFCDEILSGDFCVSLKVLKMSANEVAECHESSGINKFPPELIVMSYNISR
jgi:hypothetical protein